MPQYLVDVVGSGVDADPFRPEVWDGRGWLDFRVDLRQPAARRALVHLEQPVSHPRAILLADSPRDNLTLTRKAAIESRLGVVIQSVRLEEVIAELLLDHGRVDGSKWLPLRPSTETSSLEIHLGALRRIWSRSVDPSKNTKILSETWPTPGNNIGAGGGQDNVWTVTSGTPNVVVGAPNVLRSNAAAAVMTCKISLDTTNHRIFGTYEFPVFEAANNRVEFWCRADSADTRYSTQIGRNSAGSIRRLLRVVTGANTVLASDTTDPGASGAGRCSADGSTIRGVAGTFDQTVTDTGVATGDLNVGLLVLPSASGAGNCGIRGDLHMEDIVKAALLKQLLQHGAFVGSAR